jgi:glycosyltransferase involved in cell wall biosynthesis
VGDVITGPSLGTLVPFGDASALAREVIRFAESPALRESVGQAARASVLERFHLQRLVGDIKALYAELLES